MQIIPPVRLYAAPPPAQDETKSALAGVFVIAAFFGLVYWYQTSIDRSLEQARRTSKGPMTPEEFKEWLRS